MPRKKTEVILVPNGEAPTDAVSPVAVEPASVPESAPPREPRRPAASWKYPAASGVTIEVALWPHTITLQNGETIEVYNATVTRNYRDERGEWHKGGSFRVGGSPCSFTP